MRVLYLVVGVGVFRMDGKLFIRIYFFATERSIYLHNAVF